MIREMVLEVPAEKMLQCLWYHDGGGANCFGVNVTDLPEHWRIAYISKKRQDDDDDSDPTYLLHLEQRRP